MSEFDDTVDFEVSDDEEVDEVDFAGEFDMDADMTGFTESDIASFLDTMIDVQPSQVTQDNEGEELNVTMTDSLNSQPLAITDEVDDAIATTNESDELDQATVEDDESLLAATDDSDEQPLATTDEIDDEVTETTDDDEEDALSDLKHTPAQQSDLGIWLGERGESLFVPLDEESQRILSALDLDGIPYKNGIPDFSQVAAATVYLTQKEMRLTDYRQKRLANETLQDLLDDDEYETLNDDVIDAVYDGDSEGELEALYDLDVPNGFVWHHGEKTQDGSYELLLVPLALHWACIHCGARSHTNTKR